MGGPGSRSRLKQECTGRGRGYLSSSGTSAKFRPPAVPPPRGLPGSSRCSDREPGSPRARAAGGSSGRPSAPAGGASLDPTEGGSQARLLSAAAHCDRPRGGDAATVAAAPCRPNRSAQARRWSGAGSAMWFMYVLSWLSLFIQVAFITLAVGERVRDPAPRGLPSACACRGSHHEGAGATGETPARPSRLRSAPPVPPGPASPGLSSLADRGSFQESQSPPQRCPGGLPQMPLARAPPTAVAPVLARAGRARLSPTPTAALSPLALRASTLSDTLSHCLASSYC